MRNALPSHSAANTVVAQNLYTPRPIAELSPILTPGTDSRIVDQGVYVLGRIAFVERWQALVGTAPSNRANSGEVLPPSVNKQKDLGAKARLGGRVLLQAALFDIEACDLTVNPLSHSAIARTH